MGALWSLPTKVFGYVLAVEAAAVGAAGYTATLLPVTRVDVVRFAIIGACALVYLEVAPGLVRQAEIMGGPGPYLDFKTVWNFAAVLVLPPVLSTAMMVLTFGYTWIRTWPHAGPVQLYRLVFSAATVVLASQVAIAILNTSGHYPGIPPGLGGLAIILVAALVRWMINYGLVVGAIALSGVGLRAALAGLSRNAIEISAIGLAVAVAGLLVSQPALVPGIAAAILVLRRTEFVDQYQRASRTDAKTGLYNAEWWRQLALRELARAGQHGRTVGVLIADLDQFKRINDTYGHPAGDDVLRAVAQALGDEVRRESDVVGRFGGEEFVVLLPGTVHADLLAAAERIRLRVRGTAIDIATATGPDVVTMTISIGAASYPADGATLDELLVAADTALYVAKAGGRDQSVLVS